MGTRRVVSRNSSGHSRSAQTRPSSLLFHGHHLFVVFFCGIVAFSIINMLILKNEFIFRVEMVVSEGVVTVPKPPVLSSKKQSQVRHVKNLQLEASMETEAEDLHTLTTKVHIISSEDASVHSNSSLVEDKRVKMKQVAGHHEAHPPEDWHTRISALALANETMRKHNINIIQHEIPEPQNTVIKPKKHGKGLSQMNVWYDDTLFENITLPSDYVAEYPLDPLSKQFDTSSLIRISVQPEVKYWEFCWMQVDTTSIFTGFDE